MVVHVNQTVFYAGQKYKVKKILHFSNEFSYYKLEDEFGQIIYLLF